MASIKRMVKNRGDVNMGSARRRLAIQQEQLEDVEEELKDWERAYIVRKNYLLKRLKECKERRDFQQSLIDDGDIT